MTIHTAQLDAEQILAILEGMHAEEDVARAEGLRDRKKRRLRQLISNVATAHFLAEGYDSVSVARIAAACDVSEQTLFNYFPSKESMFLDRTDSTSEVLAEVIRGRRDDRLSAAIARAFTDNPPQRRWEALDESIVLRLLRLFAETIDGSAALRVAFYTDLPRFIGPIEAALAERRGCEPVDPEVQVTASVIAGLDLLRSRIVLDHARNATSLRQLTRAVHDDLRRAMAVAAPSLDAFDERGQAMTED